jgi:nitronate monooxygenase
MLGAAGVWMGTRFVASKESPFHETYKMMLVKAAESDTDYNTLFDLRWKDAPVRTLRSNTIVTWEKAGRPPEGKRPGEGELVVKFPNGGGIPRYAITPPFSGMVGKVEDIALYAGQSGGLISDIRSAREIVRDLVEQTIAAVTRATDMLKT